MESYQEMGVSAKERKFKGITRAIKNNGLEILNPERLRRQAYFNRFRCPYKTFFPNSKVTTKEILIELAAQTPAFPAKEMPIQSFIEEYLSAVNLPEEIELYELQPFMVLVQAVERTLVDKTFAMCDYYLSHKCMKHSRHLYDIGKILEVVPLNNELIELFKKTKEFRKKIVVCLSAQEGILLHDVLDHIIVEKPFYEDYERGTRLLLNEDYPYKKAEAALRSLCDFLKAANF